MSWKLMVILRLSRIEHYGLKIPTLTLHVLTLGEPGTGIIGKTGRLCDIGINTTCVGHTDGHIGDVYRIWNQKTEHCGCISGRLERGRVKGGVLGGNPLIHPPPKVFSSIF